jgi:hypothetical protein
MGIKTGYRMGFKSGQVKKIFYELSHGNKDYQKDCVLCPNKNCHAGTVYDSLTGEHDSCPKCSGYGFIRLN